MRCRHYVGSSPASDRITDTAGCLKRAKAVISAMTFATSGKGHPMAKARFCQCPRMGVTSGSTSRSCVEQEDIMQAMATETFIGNMRGPVIRPMDADYDAVRSLYNGMIDKRPVMIARCSDVADVVAAVNFAKQNDLQVAIRGGGHNGPGLGSVDDGLMIDMSMMKGVRVNPTAGTVRAGPGCTQGDVDHATHIYGLAVPAGIVSTTGIAGLTLGGGTGS